MAHMFKTPPWWWKGNDGKDLRYVYRAMRPDHADLIPADSNALPLNKNSDEFRVEVMRALCTGSHTESIFLHASTKYHTEHANSM